MPKYRNRKYNNRRRRRRRRKRKSGRMSYNIIPSTLLPDTTYVKLKYFDPALFVGDTFASQIYRGNSAFDPDQSSGTTTQPSGFDQYAQMYSHYEVIGSSIKVQLCNLSAEPARIMLIPTLSETGVLARQAYTNPYGKVKVIGGVNGNSITNLSSYMKTKKIFGRSTNSVNYSAPVGANPSSQWYWHLKVESLTVNDIDLDGNVILTYFVKFWQRKILADA